MHGKSAVHQNEIVGLDHLVVAREREALKFREALDGIKRKAKVHASLIIFEARAAAQDAANGDFEGRAKIKRDVGNHGVLIEIAEPFDRAAAGAVASEGRVDVAVGEDEMAAAQERENLAFVTVGKISGVNQRKSHGSEQAALFAAARG